MKATFYRLAEYKIIEDANGACWWESHAGLGSLIGGKCFLRGDILFIGPRETEEPGYLKNEFLIHIRKFPEWGKSKHYCASYTIYECGSGRKLVHEEIVKWSSHPTPQMAEVGSRRREAGRGHKTKETSLADEVSYRLGRYEIVEKSDGEVWWKTHSGCRSLREGKCIIAGDILLLGSGGTENPGGLKSEFLEHLNRLSEWENTRYYCPSYTLYDCTPRDHLADRIAETRRGEVSSVQAALLPEEDAGLSHASSSSPSKLLKALLAILSRCKAWSVAVKERKPVEKENHETPIKQKSGPGTQTAPRESPESSSAIPGPGRTKWIVYVAAVVLMMGALLLAVLVGFWQNEKKSQKKHDHSSSHTRDH